MTDQINQLGRPENSAGLSVLKIEQIIESVMDSVRRGEPLSIPFMRRKPARHPSRPRRVDSLETHTDSSVPTDSLTASRSSAAVSFPGKSEAESKLFTQVLSILQLSHQALLSGTYVTKRNIFYQYPELFKEQRIVDTLVDDIAYTLRIGRDSLHIVAASVGVVYGALSFTRSDGTECFASGETGIAIPPMREILDVDISRCEWLLVIEKEATFRTLAAAGYASNSLAGPGALVTKSKGYPTLVTRCFLHHVQQIAPRLPIYGLVDYDPHGVRIFRTYKYGSHGLSHEDGTTVPGLEWLGLRSGDFLASRAGSQPLDDVLPLSDNDRRAGVCLLREIVHSKDYQEQEEVALEQCREVQVMLMLSVKAEIQAADESGDLAAWLDEKLV
ncbi:meiosis-specific topoisomerase spo11 [Ophiostoma piceae UAMH 11346]|uniref:DNA topoisomerase (ATP-hydrolyzing) n=1 Tax=Ophiostoma piceae (strain UAMH 11346) TaxID=1262450 RepID=S3D6W4_OPHP1|nr:meiosis-specific topoisomerase spo11 [Ophiostoma piceae UAMH 11346]